MAYYIESDSGERFGPADAAKLSQWFFDKRIRADWTVIDGATGSRIPLSQVIQLPQEADPHADQNADRSGAPDALLSGAEMHPLETGASSQFLVIHPNGQQFGPVPPDVLFQWLQEGRVLPNWLVADSVSRQQMSVVQALAKSQGLASPPQVTQDFLELKSPNPYRMPGFILGPLSIGLALTLWLSPLALLGGIAAVILGNKSNKLENESGKVAIVCGWISIIASLVFSALLYAFLKFA